jgi:hypothetical protein
MEIKDYLSFKDNHEKHGLRGHVQVFRQNMETGETSLWDEGDNIIPISGYQWILMKMFGLYLDSKHDPSNATMYEVLDKDSTVVIPDLNGRANLSIGKPINSYTKMNGDIAANHICQGFMVGNGGGAEDGITTKNTDYSFVALRNPIPFQQTNTELDPSVAGQYLGMLNVTGSSEANPFSKSYYIKKFDERPHIYHSWWRENQKWDYVDPVTTADLGPNSQASPKTNRIESYIECKLSLSDDDCFSYFSHQGQNSTPAINELGLVAFDADAGARSGLENCYHNEIQSLIGFIFDNNRPPEVLPEIVRLTASVLDTLTHIQDNGETRSIVDYNQPNMTAFFDTLSHLSAETVESLTNDPTILVNIQDELSKTANIEVKAYYDQRHNYIYEEDKFLEYLSAANFNQLSTDEAQRIKLVTYYTFNSIPLQKNWRTLINYRIYAN